MRSNRGWADFELVQFLIWESTCKIREIQVYTKWSFWLWSWKKTSLWTSVKPRTETVQNSLETQTRPVLILLDDWACRWKYLAMTSRLHAPIHANKKNIPTCVQTLCPGVNFSFHLPSHLRLHLGVLRGGAAGVFSRLVIEPDLLAQLTLTHNICSAVLGFCMAWLQRWGRPQHRRPEPSITAASWRGRGHGLKQESTVKAGRRSTRHVSVCWCSFYLQLRPSKYCEATFKELIFAFSLRAFDLKTFKVLRRC